MQQLADNTVAPSEPDSQPPPSTFFHHPEESSLPKEKNSNIETWKRTVGHLDDIEVAPAKRRGISSEFPRQELTTTKGRRVSKRSSDQIKEVEAATQKKKVRLAPNRSLQQSRISAVDEDWADKYVVQETSGSQESDAEEPMVRGNLQSFTNPDDLWARQRNTRAVNPTYRNDY